MAIDAFTLSSCLPAEYREDVEAVLFFNPQQPRVLTGILQSVEQYGAPEICVDDDVLRVRVGTLKDVQTLFALADSEEGAELAGVIVYLRTDVENVLILHIGVTEAFSSTGPSADAMLVMRLLQAVRDAVRRLKGVRSIKVVYPAGKTLTMPVSSPPRPMASATS